MTRAGQLMQLAEAVLGGPLPVRVRAWDGSEAGPRIGTVDETGTAEGPVLVVRHRRALCRLLWSPGELGLARAFVAGELDVDGDLSEGLRRFWRLAGTPATRRAGWRVAGPAALNAAVLAVRLGVIGLPPRPPAGEARLAGRLHSVGRDRAAIAHHYDLGNEFYRLLLDPEMAYSCGYWPDGPDMDLARAQRAKFELICVKLGLRPGMRLLDVGCGWGGLLIHAARHHGVRGVGVTLSEAQRAYATERIHRLGLADRVEVRVRHFRELDEAAFDAVASVEMGEHVGRSGYPDFAAGLLRLLRPRGRLLVQQMSRGAAGPDGHPGGGAFIERFIAPDMWMRPLGDTVALLEQAGHEVVDVQSLREHYVWTVRPWLRTLRERRAELVAEVGEQQWRIWLLYLTGAALAFEQGRMGVHQILCVRPEVTGATGLSPDRAAYTPAGGAGHVPGEAVR